MGYRDGKSHHFPYLEIGRWSSIVGCHQGEFSNLTLIEYHQLPPELCSWNTVPFRKGWTLSLLNGGEKKRNRRRNYECPLRVLMRSEEPLQAEFPPRDVEQGRGLIDSSRYLHGWRSNVWKRMIIIITVMQRLCKWIKLKRSCEEKLNASFNAVLSSLHSQHRSQQQAIGLCTSVP